MATPTCESCGARIEPAHLTCPFCNAITPFGLRQREQDDYARLSRDAAEVHAAQGRDFQARGVAQIQLEALGRQSVIWSVVGVVLCCFPVPSLVALVLAYRARVVAREKGFVFPAQATIGLLLSIVTLLMSASFYAFAGVSAVQKQRRIHGLETETAASATAATIDHDTACKLIEILLLHHGYSSCSDSIDNFACDGALEQHGTTAIVHDVAFDVTSTSHTADATLRHGARWLVEALTDVSSRPASRVPGGGAAPPPAAVPSAVRGAPSVRPAPHHEGHEGGAPAKQRWRPRARARAAREVAPRAMPHPGTAPASARWRV